MVASELLFTTLILLMATTIFIGMIEGVRAPMRISKDMAKYVCRQRTRFVRRGVLEKPIKENYRPISPLRCGWYVFGNCDKNGTCSYEMYEHCSDYVKEKTIVQTRIHGGNYALPHSYPSVVLMLKKRGFCGAVIISEEWVITAAQCTSDSYEQDIVLLGGRHNPSKNESESEQRIEGVKKIFEYPTYKPNETTFAADDISLLELYKDAQFVFDQYQYVDYAEPAPSGYKPLAKATLVGWGDRTDGVFLGPLQEANMTIITDTECQKAFGSAIRNENICTYTKGMSGCVRDTGGPLLQFNDGEMYVIGIQIGAGPKCSYSNKPTIYTEISQYYGWILEHHRRKSRQVSNRSRLQRSRSVQWFPAVLK